MATQEAQVADTLTTLVARLRKKLGRPVKILEIGAGDGSLTDHLFEELREHKGFDPKSIEYYAQDVRTRPTYAGRIPDANINILARTDAATPEGLAELKTHGLFDIVLTMNVKGRAGINLAGERKTEKGYEAIIRALHKNTRTLLHRHGVMVDAVYEADAHDYIRPPRNAWKRSSSSDELLHVHTKRTIRPAHRGERLARANPT